MFATSKKYHSNFFKHKHSVSHPIYIKKRKERKENYCEVIFLTLMHLLSKTTLWTIFLENISYVVHLKKF